MEYLPPYEDYVLSSNKLMTIQFNSLSIDVFDIFTWYGPGTQGTSQSLPVRKVGLSGKLPRR